MRQSAATLNAFYASRLGRAAARQVNQRLMDLWGPCSGQTILGVGYTQTVLPLWETQAARCVGAIPEGIGASRLDGARGQVMCLTPEHRLPFHDQQFTRIVLLHALEEADHPRSLLREAWRVLAPEGRIVVAVANRKSFWSVTEAQAFGHGRPWTRRQLIAFLNDSLFQVTASTTAVHMPPINWRLITAAANAWERVGERVLPALGGVVLVEATKRLYAHPGGSAPATVTNARPASTKPVSLPRKEAA